MCWDKQKKRTGNTRKCLQKSRKNINKNHRNTKNWKQSEQ